MIREGTSSLNLEINLLVNLCTSYDCSDDESEGGIGRKVAIDGSGGVSGHDNDGVIVNYPRNKRHSTGDVASEVAPFRSSLLARKGSQTQLWTFRSIYIAFIFS